jgi:cell division protein FtsB
MDRETLLESLLNSTIERMGRQTKAYEAEIANLNAEIMIAKADILDLQDEISTLETMNISVNDIKKNRSAFRSKEEGDSQEIQEDQEG